eukprot:g30549.t1
MSSSEAASVAGRADTLLWGARLQQPRGEEAHGLDHLNLLRLFEAFRDGDRCAYLVTELCASGSLAERLEQQRRRDPKQARLWGVIFPHLE